MLSSLLRALFGTNTEREIKSLIPLLEAVREHEPRCVAMTNDQLRAQTAVFKQRIAQGATLDELLPEAFAVVCEASKRVTGMRPFDVQILGGIVLHQGRIAEMVTGEGKTLVATMPIYLNALEGKGVHLVTVNDYLARRDSEWMGPIYQFLGLTVGLIQHDMGTAERQVGYRADITYGTNNEFGFDYLRDNMAVRPEMRVQRMLNYAIVDEIDSILIDEARTPLIISGRPEKSTDIYYRIDEVVCNRRMGRNTILCEINNFEKLLARLKTPADPLRARMPAEVQTLIDTCDGSRESMETLRPDVADALLRLNPQGADAQLLKPYAEQELVELKTPFEINEKHHQVILSDGGMRMAEHLLGVGNLYSDENLGLQHMLEQSLRAHYLYKRDDEYVVQGGNVLIVDEFTGRLMEGRRYADGLHQAIEAKERVPVQFETQTIATITYQNYFKLYRKIAGMTGTAATEAMEFSQIYNLEVVGIPTNLPLIREDRNDLVFATEEGKFHQVVDEIAVVHETGRPVLVGTVSIEKSERVAELLDERGIRDFQVLNAKFHEREAAIVANAGKRGSITIATNMAGRGTDIKLGEGVRELGGLAIVGTERHESRRIDNQLRGRCGRQGDPGSTQFFLSLEDEVARLFGGDKVKKLLDWFGSQQMDDEPLGQRMVSRSIERAQKQVEEFNFEARKHLKEYDDVMNKQRQIIYDMRRDVLEDRDVTERLRAMFENLVADMVAQYAADNVLPDEWDLDGLAARFRSLWGFEADFAGREDEEPKPLIEELLSQVLGEYQRREGLIEAEIRQSFREQIGGDESLVDFPRLARKRVHDLEMMALLRAVDEKWIDHLYSMDYLRDSVRLRAYGQKDPLVEYKSEAFEMFETMMASIEEEVAQTLFRLTDPEVRRRRRVEAQRGTLRAQDDPFAQLSHYSYIAADKQQDRSFSSYDTSRFALAGQPDAQQQVETRQESRPRIQQVRNIGPQTKPNDPCPCGSGKKYKKCCGALS